MNFRTFFSWPNGHFSWLTVLTKKTYTASKCGHETRRQGHLTAFGERVLYTLRLNAEGTVDYCHACLSKAATRCFCSCKPIFPGDRVLVSVLDKDVVPDDAPVIERGTEVIFSAQYCDPVDVMLAPVVVWSIDDDGKGYLRYVEEGVGAQLLTSSGETAAHFPGDGTHTIVDIGLKG